MVDDVGGAQEVGMKGILVQTGKHRRVARHLNVLSDAPTAE